MSDSTPVLRRAKAKVEAPADMATLTAASVPFRQARFFINALEPGEADCAGETYVVPAGRYEVVSTNAAWTNEELALHLLGVLQKRGATLERVVE